MASVEENNTDKVKIKNYLSANVKDLADVHAAHKKSLEVCEEEITQWKKFIKDYNVLQEKLTTYPDKTSYEAVIPIGSLAYMKGRKIHTNEILVHLGENWFAERSVKDAVAIIARRKEVCEEKLKCTEREREIHEGWLKQTQELAEREKVQILEQISEEEYEQSKEKHKEIVAKHFALMSEGKEDGKEPLVEDVSIPNEIKNFEDLLKRLDALEEEERIKDELTELGEYNEDEEIEGGEDDDDDDDDKEGSSPKPDGEAESSSAKSKKGKKASSGKEKLQRRVSWADQLTERKQDEEEEEEEEDDEDDDDDDHHEDRRAETAKIKYRSRQQSLPAELIPSSWEKEEPEAQPQEDIEIEEEVAVEVEVETEQEEVESEVATPQSPSDLYKMFGPHAEPNIVGQPTKGILKKKGDSFQTEDTEKGVGWSDTHESITYIPSSPEEPILTRNPPLSESPKEIKNLKPAFSYKVVARDQGKTTPTSPPTTTTPTEEPKRISRFKASRLDKEEIKDME